MPLSNAFIIINLGCEMLYVVDQRLKAQCITLEKSTQVLRDLTSVLLDPRFLDKLLNPHQEQQLLTSQQCRLLLSDIACCSLMRLDITSMDKLWDLMIMVVKWQIANIKDTQQLLDLTFRHMDGVGKLIPESRKTILIDCAKRHLIEFWDSIVANQQGRILRNIIKWFHPFNIKISILIRLGFQRSDGLFEMENVGEHFKYFSANIGENIYVKHSNLKANCSLNGQQVKQILPTSNELASLVHQLNISHEDLKFSNVLDDVTFAMESETERLSYDEKEESQFVHLPRLNSTLKTILEKCKFETEQTESSDIVGDGFNVTDELLKMLEEKSE